MSALTAAQPSHLRNRPCPWGAGTETTKVPASRSINLARATGIKEKGNGTGDPGPKQNGDSQHPLSHALSPALGSPSDVFSVDG